MHSGLNIAELKAIFDPIADWINRDTFIEDDPISIPHGYTLLQDIEIAAFFSAVFAWGQRKTIISKTKQLLKLMDDQPYDFVLNHQPKDLIPLMTFKHRTFQSSDLLYFIDFLQRYYQNNTSLETAFHPNPNQAYNQKDALIHFYNLFFDHEHALERTKKHISTPAKKSACKRMNMLLRWLVRADERKVDLGIWKTIPTSALMIPLDVHVEKYARQFGILTRKQRDWQAVEEITAALRLLNPDDPVIYDYALFGMSIKKDLDI